MKSAIEKHLYLALAAVAAIAGFMVYAVVKNTREATRTSDWVRHTHATILEVQGIQSGMVGAEAAARAYLLAKTPAALDWYRQAISELQEHMSVAKTLASDSADEMAKLEQIERIIAQRVERLNSAIKAREKNSAEESARLVLETEGVGALQQVKTLTGEVRHAEEELLQERDRAAKSNARRTRWISFGLATFKILLLAAVFGLVKADLRLRREAAQALQGANEMLEAKVQERTSDLLKMNRALELENLERRWSHSALEQAAQRNELIINSIGQPIFVVSRRGNILGVNPAGALCVGQSRENLTGKSIRAWLRPNPAPEAGAPGKDPLQIALNEGKPSGEQQVCIDQQGAAKAFQIAAFPMRAEGKVVGAVLTLRPETS